MNKKIVLVIALMLVVLVFCLTGCNSDFQFSKLELSADNVTKVSVTYDGDTKPTMQQSKITKIIENLNGLEVAECKEKINEIVFTDNVIGKVTIEQEGKDGSFVMIFAKTNINGEQIALLKCEALDGFKIKNMPKKIYQMANVEQTNTLLSKLFANYI